MRFRRKKSDDAGAEGTTAAVPDPVAPAAPPYPEQGAHAQPPQQSDDTQQQPGYPSPPSGEHQDPFGQATDSAGLPTGATDPAAGPAAFDMRTVGIAPTPDTGGGWMGEPVVTGTAAAAAPAPQAQPVRKKGHHQPPMAADITSVGVAILPGVPLPSWVTPSPAPVAQYAEQPVAAPVDQPVAAPVDQPVAAPTYRAAAQSPDQPAATPAPPPLQAMPAPSVQQLAGAGMASVPPVAAVPAATVAAPEAAAPRVPVQAGALPPPDPSQWSEHPLGPVVWGVAPAAQSTSPENPPPPPSDAGPATPLVAVSAATTAGSAWFRDDDTAPAGDAAALTTPADESGPTDVEEYGWLLQPDTPDNALDAMASPTPTTRTAYLSAPPPTGRSYDFDPPAGRIPNAAPPTIEGAESTAPVSPWFDPAALEPPAPAAPVAQWAAPTVATAAAATAGAAAATGLPVTGASVTVPPPTTARADPPPPMPPPPMPAPVGPPQQSAPDTEPTVGAEQQNPTPTGADSQTEPQPGDTAGADEDVPEDANPQGEAKSKRRALTWILIIGGALVALAAAAYAALVTPGFLSSSATPDTPPAVATPATAGGLSKAAKAAEPATGVFEKMAATTSASSGSQTATYANESVTATTWIAPVFGGSPDAIAEAYTAAGGANMGELATVPAGPRGGSMSCAAVSPKQTLCFWTTEGIRGATDVTGLGRSAAGELTGKMRIALEPQQP